MRRSVPSAAPASGGAARAFAGWMLLTLFLAVEIVWQSRPDCGLRSVDCGSREGRHSSSKADALGASERSLDALAIRGEFSDARITHDEKARQFVFDSTPSGSPASPEILPGNPVSVSSVNPKPQSVSPDALPGNPPSVVSVNPKPETRNPSSAPRSQKNPHPSPCTARTMGPA